MHIEIVTPHGPAYSGQVAEITLQGSHGEIGILPGHIPFLTVVSPGVLTLLEDSKQTRRFAVGPGFLQVAQGDKVTALVDACLPADEVDAAAAQRTLAEAQKQMESLGVDPEQAAAFAAQQAKAAWAKAQLDVAGKTADAPAHH